jgi:hypothetical protein
MSNNISFQLIKPIISTSFKMSLSAALQRILLQELKSKSRNAEIFETLYQPFIGIQVITARAHCRAGS